jgi:hypothetical protein
MIHGLSKLSFDDVGMNFVRRRKRHEPPEERAILHHRKSGSAAPWAYGGGFPSRMGCSRSATTKVVG